MNRNYAVALCLIVLTMVATGCGGGGGGQSSAGGGSGTVALLLTDGPADEYDHIWIWVSEITLLREDQSPVRVFTSETAEGLKLDLLDLRDEELLLTIDSKVPAGAYSGIRLQIEDVEAEGGTGSCADLTIKVPGQKIVFNPRGGFHVAAGQALVIRLDVDANKSINLHTAGNSGKCIFRPVVFVDIASAGSLDRCVQELMGQITALTLNPGGETVGFALALPGNRGTVDVALAPGVVIFSSAGSSVTPDALSVGDRVRVQGQLGTDGVLVASAIVQGDSQVIEGTVLTAVDGNNQFSVLPATGEWRAGNAVDIDLPLEAVIEAGCDQTATAAEIQPGLTARVLLIPGAGPGDPATAVSVRIFPGKVSGALSAITDTVGGRALTVKLGAGQTLEVHLPDGQPLRLEGDGPVPDAVTDVLLACGIEPAIRITVDPDAATPTSLDARLVAATRFGTISLLTPESRRLTLDDGERVDVLAGATIYRQGSGTLADRLIGFEELATHDAVTVFGLADCSGDPTDFYGFVLIVQ